MYIYVKLLNGFSESLVYEVSQEFQVAVTLGTLVTVPLRNKTYLALVIEVLTAKPVLNFVIKKIIKVEQFPDDPSYYPFIKQLAYYYQTEPLHFVKRIKFFLKESETSTVIMPFENTFDKTIIQTTVEQQEVVDFMYSALQEQRPRPTLLHGVTGSGKTEIYKKIIVKAFEQNKSIILLLPEVSLALQFYHILKAELPSSITLYSFHSGTTAKEKKAVWNALLSGAPCLIIGVHLPILLPFKNLGLIIVDEEHEHGYQEKKHPKVNSKEAALMRSQLLQIPILLGSATPSLSSLYNVKHKNWHFFQLKKRFKGVFPAIKIVELPENKNRKNFWISKELEDALRLQLQKKEQSLLFLNRRGYSFFLQCKHCSFIIYCQSCSVSLTVHESNRLQCHYCGFSCTVPLQCTQCKSPDFLKKGIGTQQVAQIIQRLLPQARIARADLDITSNKKLWARTLNDFQEGTLDILIGTQTITKGYNFPKVSLVGILWADLNLHFPLYNAFETTLQQLIQVAGRAGRFGLESNVIVQTMASYDLFNYLNEKDYLNFYNQELSNRQAASYPPFVRLAEIEIKHVDEKTVQKESTDIMNYLHKKNNELNLGVTILGPASPPLSKIKNYHIRKIYLKSSNICALIQLFQPLNALKLKSSIFFTPNPLS